MAVSGTTENKVGGAEAKPAQGQRSAPATKSTAAEQGGRELQFLKAEENEETPEFVLVESDVVEEFTAMGTKRPSQRLKFHAGQVLTKEQAEAAGVKGSKVQAERTSFGAAVLASNTSNQDPGTIGSAR